MATLKDLSEKVRKMLATGSSNVSNYFKPTSNAGNNFWSSKPAQTLASFQKTTAPIARPAQVASKGIVDVSTMGLTKNPFSQYAPQTTGEKVAYGVGAGLGLVNPLNPLRIGTKALTSIKGVNPLLRIAQKPLGGLAGNLIAKGGVAKYAGRGVANLSQGIPYGITYGVAKNLTGQKYTKGDALTDLGADLALGAIPGVGGLLIGQSARGFKKMPKFEGMDNKLRAEISDLVARIQPTKIKKILGTQIDDTTVKFARLGDFFEHASLFNSYPQLRNLRIKFEGTPGVTNSRQLGSFDPQSFSIKIDPRLKPDDMRSTLLHEVQHAIQEIEGFARGGNLQSIVTNNINVSAVRRELNETNTRLQKSLDNPKFDIEGNKRVAGNLTEYEKALDDKIRKIKSQLSYHPVEGMNYYKRLLGEIEARAVERRANLTSQQRKELPFYENELRASQIQPENVITRFETTQPAKTGDLDDLFQKTRKYTARVYSGDGWKSKLVEIKGAKPIQVIPNLDTFIHKSVDPNDPGRWVITEFKTGLKVVDGKTRSEAIEKAKNLPNFLKERGFPSVEETMTKKLQELHISQPKGVGGIRTVKILNRFGMPNEVKILDKITNAQGEKYVVEYATTPGRTYKIPVNELDKQIKDFQLTQPPTGRELGEKGGDLLSQPQGGRGVTQKAELPIKIKGEAEPILKIGSLPDVQAQPKPKFQLSQTKSELPELRKDTQVSEPTSKESFDEIISQAKGQIGLPSEKSKTIKQTINDFYTDWVNRFHPIEKLARSLEKGGLDIPSKLDPRITTKQLLGAGGVAEYRHKKKLEPILNQLGDIARDDFDVFLKAKRDLNLGERGIKGSDVNQAQRVIQSLGQKYNINQLDQVAENLYQYQDEGLQMLKQAGILGDESYQQIKNVSKNYVPFQRVMDDISDYLGLPTAKAYLGTQPLKKIKGSDRQIISPLESIIADTYKIEAAVSKNRVAQSLVGLQNLDPKFKNMFQKVSKDSKDAIAVWENGKKNFYLVGEDIAKSIKGLNEESAGILVKILSAPARLLRQGATGRNIDFMIPNVVKDQFDAAVSSQYGYRPFIDYFRGLGHLLNYEKAGSDEIVEGWLKSGGSIFFENMGGRKQLREQIQDATTQKKLATRIKDWVITGIDTVGKYSETPTRLGVYKRALEKTSDPLKAMADSREATVDFARMGAKMKTANSIIPFLNVGVQGFDKVVRNVKNNPGKMAVAMATYAGIPQIMVSLYNNLYHPEEYAKVPQWEKDTNFIIVTGINKEGKPAYIKVPKGNVVPLIANPTDHFISYLSGTNNQSFGQLATSMLSSALPVLGEGKNLKEVLVKTIGSNTPQAIKPIAENLFNKSSFYTDEEGNPSDIVPFYLKDKPAYQQTFKSTSQVYQTLGKMLNISPLQIKNVLEGYLAGYIKAPVNTIDLIKDASEGKELDPNKVVVLRRFFGIREDYTSSTAEKKKTSPFAVSAAEKGKLPEEKEDLAVLYKQANSILDSYREKKVKEQYSGDEQGLTDLQNKVDEAIALKKQIESQYPEKIFEIELDTNASGGGATVEERAEWAFKTLSKAKSDDEKNKLINQMLEAKVLTKSVTEALQKAGLDINKYIEGGKVRTLGGSGGSTKKVSVGKVSVAKISPKAPSRKAAFKISMPSVPNLKISPITARKIALPKEYDVPNIRIAQLPGLTIKSPKNIL